MTREVAANPRIGALEILAENINLRSSDFVRLNGSYVYSDVIKSDKDITIDGENLVKSGVIVNMDYSDNTYLNALLTEKYGVKFRQGSFREVLMAAYSNQTKDFRDKVLDHFWVWNRETITKIDETSEWVRVDGKYWERPSGAYYAKLTGVVPTRADLTKNRKNAIVKFEGVYFGEDGRAAIRSHWFSGENPMLRSMAIDMHYRNDGGSISLWTDESIRK